MMLAGRDFRAYLNDNIHLSWYLARAPHLDLALKRGAEGR